MTPAVLKSATLEEIGAVPAGGPYPADDVAKVTEKYEALHAELLSHSLVTWALTEDIPTKFTGVTLAMLAFSCASAFGVAEPRYSRLRREGAFGDAPQSLAERKLRQLLAQTHVSFPAESEYF